MKNIFLTAIFCLLLQSCTEKASIKDLRGCVVIEKTNATDAYPLYNSVTVKYPNSKYAIRYHVLKIDSDNLKTGDTIK